MGKLKDLAFDEISEMNANKTKCRNCGKLIPKGDDFCCEFCENDYHNYSNKPINIK